MDAEPLGPLGAEAARLSGRMPRGSAVWFAPYSRPGLYEVASVFGVVGGSVRVRLRGFALTAPADRLTPWVEPAAVAFVRRLEFVRAGGRAACDSCGRVYLDHPTDPAEPCLVIACDGTRLKL
jgi:hypothetical protein